MAADDLVLRSGADEVVLVADRSRANAYVLRVGRTDQSYVDLDDPLHLEFDYVQRLADVADVIAAPGQRIRVVHVGGAGLSMARYLAATRPHSTQVVLEPDVELTAFVRQHLPLPRRSGIKVRAVDGRRGLSDLSDGFAGLVVLDAFVGARVPAELTTVECLADIARVVSPAGTLAANVTDRGLDYARRVTAGLQAIFDYVALVAEPATLKGRRFGNIVLVASAAPLPTEALTRRAAASPFVYRLVSGAALDRLVAGASPFADGAAEPSPDPVPGRAHFG